MNANTPPEHDTGNPAGNALLVSETIQLIDENLTALGFDVRIVLLGRGAAVGGARELLMAFTSVSRVSNRARASIPSTVGKLREIANEMEAQWKADQDEAS